MNFWQKVKSTISFKKVCILLQAQEMQEIAVDREIWIAVQENFDITTTFEEYVVADDSVSTTETSLKEAIVESVLALNL